MLLISFKSKIFMALCKATTSVKRFLGSISDNSWAEEKLNTQIEMFKKKAFIIYLFTKQSFKCTHGEAKDSQSFVIINQKPQSQSISCSFTVTVQHCITSPSWMSVNFSNDRPHSVSLFAWLMSSTPRFMVANFPVTKKKTLWLKYLACQKIDYNIARARPI